MFKDLDIEAGTKLILLYKLVFAVSGLVFGCLLIAVGAIAVPAGWTNALTWVTDCVSSFSQSLSPESNEFIQSISGFLNSFVGVSLLYLGMQCIRFSRLQITFLSIDDTKNLIP